VRISELSRRSGVSIPTIKYYLREGLLPAGTPTGSTQAEYGDPHLQRLHFIRVMLDVGRLSISALRDVISALADERRSTHDVLGVAHRALAVRSLGVAPDPAARAEIAALLDALGWRATADPATVDELGCALVALRRLGWSVDGNAFGPYAAAVDALAAAEVAYAYDTNTRDQAVERAVVGTVVFETVLTAMRRLAQAHHSGRAPDELAYPEVRVQTSSAGRRDPDRHRSRAGQGARDADPQRGRGRPAGQGEAAEDPQGGRSHPAQATRRAARDRERRDDGR
jgi:DNA-binding transcriptional MerR regulator